MASKMINFARRHSRRKRDKAVTKQVPKRVIDNFFVGPLLGVGGYAVVHVGKHIKTGEKVALKVLKADKHGKLSESKKNQFDKAIDLLNTVSHVNVLKLVGFNKDCEFPETNGTRTKCLLMALENAPSGELFDYLMYTGNFDEITSRSYFQQLIAGLGAIHACGYTHRDLKPENLLLDSNYKLKIADFGFASAEAKMRTACGTKGYLAPELIKGSKYNKGVDVFAAGIILFIMYAGFPPFNDAIATDWWWNRLENGWKERETQVLLDKKGEWSRHGLFFAAHERTLKFPADLKAFLLKLFHWDPRKRPTCEDIQNKSREFFLLPKALYGKKEAHLKGKEKYQKGLSWFNKPVKTDRQLAKYLEDRRKEVFKNRAEKISEQQQEHAIEQGLVNRDLDGVVEVWDADKESYEEYALRGRYRDLAERIDPGDNYFKYVQEFNADFVSLTPHYFFTKMEPSVVMAVFETVALAKGGKTMHFPKESRMTIKAVMIKEKTGITLEAKFEVNVCAFGDKYMVTCKRLRGDFLAFRDNIQMYLSQWQVAQIVDVGSNDGKVDSKAVSAQAEFGATTMKGVSLALGDAPVDLE